jgi:hypothetical protein
MTVLFWLLVGHAVADYPLQGDFLAKAKNHKAPIPGVDWWIALLNHAAMHGGAVALITGSVALGVVETAIHCGIDWLKCDGRTSFRADQALHVVCKVAWCVVVAWT